MRLFVSPMSVEILEAVFKARGDVHLTCSVGHVGPKNYTGFSYDVFFSLYERFAEQYDSKPLVERDHLGKSESIGEMLN